MLKLALPNGSLEQNTLRLFHAAGLTVTRNGRAHFGRIADPLISEVFLTRPQAIPRLVREGKCDVGLCGKDCVLEDGMSYYYTDGTQETTVCIPSACIVSELPYSRKSLQEAKIVLIGSHDYEPITDRRSEFQLGDILRNKQIYSEYPGWTKRRFTHNQGIYVVPSPGSTEAHIPLEFPFGICLTETGKTIQDNGLRIIMTLEKSPVVLIANTRSWVSYPDGISKMAICALRDRLQEAFTKLRGEE